MANILPARNFWADNTFLGVKPDNQKIEIFGGDRTEKYLDLEKFGSYFLPRKIIITVRLGPPVVLTKEYIVEKIIFSKEPTAQWLDEMNEKHSQSVNFPLKINQNQVR